MKKLSLVSLLLLLSTMMMAGSLVKINYSGRTELERLFSSTHLTVHYYNDNEVFATAEHFDANTMVMIDEHAFDQNDVYTLVYCPADKQQGYLAGKSIDVICQTNNYLVVKGIAMPYKNDGAVAIFNKEARLPRLTRDFPVVTEEDPRIREMMSQVNMDSLEATVQYLQDYQNRMWNTSNAFAASDWIASRMEALGLEVEQQAFNASTWSGSGEAAPNVIGIQRGTLYPDIYVVCGSHFDSFSYEALYGGGTCPGADDNATGVASVLESARIMTQYQFEYSIVYCAFGCEEMGLFGSEAYASRCQQEGKDIIGYFNNDMNGYLYGDQIHIHCIYPSTVQPIGDYYMNVGNIYFPDMPVEHKDLSYGDSDHTSFNNHGYMGIYPFEDIDHESPYIHSPQDLIGPSVNSFAMSQRYCQMNIGCLAEIANPIGELPAIYCNPVENFQIDEYPFVKDLSSVILTWSAPVEGSTGELDRYEVFRDGQLHATLEPSYYEYQDTITEGLSADFYINAVYSDGCEAASETLTATGQITHLEENSLKALVYPNPADGELTIQMEGLQHVAIFTVTGQQVALKEAQHGKVVVTTEDYPQGLYLVQLISDQAVVIRNIVIK